LGLGSLWSGARHNFLISDINALKICRVSRIASYGFTLGVFWGFLEIELFGHISDGFYFLILCLATDTSGLITLLAVFSTFPCLACVRVICCDYRIMIGVSET